MTGSVGLSSRSPLSRDDHWKPALYPSDYYRPTILEDAAEAYHEPWRAGLTLLIFLKRVRQT